MAHKHCSYGICKSDSRHLHRLKEVRFFTFPNPIKEPLKCKRWVDACSRKGFTVENVKYYTFICGLHFVDGKGPTPEDPDPVPANYSMEEDDAGLEKITANEQELTTPNLEKVSYDVTLPECEVILNEGETLAECEVILNEEVETTWNYEDVFPKQHLTTPKCEDVSNDTWVPDCENDSNMQPETALLDSNDEAQSDVKTLSTPRKFLDGIFTINVDVRDMLLEFGAKGWCVQLLPSFIKLRYVAQDAAEKTLSIDMTTGKYSIVVGGTELPQTHEFYNDAGLSYIKDKCDLEKILLKLDKWLLCCGHNEDRFCKAFNQCWEKTMHLCPVTKSIRSNDCVQLSPNRRCSNCQHLRKYVLNKTLRIEKRKAKIDASASLPYKHMTKEQLIQRCKRRLKEKYEIQLKLKYAKSKIQMLSARN